MDVIDISKCTLNSTLTVIQQTFVFLSTFVQKELDNATSTDKSAFGHFQFSHLYQSLVMVI